MSQVPSTRKQRTTRKSRTIPGYFQSTGPDCTDVTVYQQGGVAVVREERTMELRQGSNEVLLEGMPSQYEQNSLTVLGYEGAAGDLSLGPISYRAANLDKARILAKSIDQPVTIQQLTGDGHTLTHKGTLKAVFGSEAAIERADTHTLFFANVSAVELDNGIPQGLSATPSLVMTPRAKNDGAAKVKLLYETSGFGWSARHSAFYDAKANKLTCFETSVSIVNGSGATFKDACLRLLAGANYSRRRNGMEGRMMPMAASMAPKGGRGVAMAESVQFDAADSSQESVGDQRMYTLADAVTIADGETQQVTLQRASNVAVKHEYFVDAGYYQSASEDDAHKTGASIRLRMVNDAAHNLGKALPAGDLNIFQIDASGAPQKISAQSFGHVAEGEKFKIEFGPSSEVKVSRRLMAVQDFDVARPKTDAAPAASQRKSAAQPQPEQPPLKFREEERLLVVHNFKDEAVTVLVSENFNDDTVWLVKPEMHEFVQEASGAHTAKVEVAAKGKTTLRFRIRYQIGW